MDNDNRQLTGLDELEKLIELCSKHKLKSIQFNGVQFEFADTAHFVPMDDQSITNAIEKFRKTADQEDKDFERTLFHSAEAS